MTSMSDWIGSLQADGPIPEAHRQAIRRLAVWLCREAVVAPLLFVCTHNARRSILAEAAWNALAARAGDAGRFPAFSAGTESGQVSPYTLEALRRAGFALQNDPLPVQLSFDQKAEASSLLFSKPLGHNSLPREGFAAVMVCAAADATCPSVPGAAARIALPLDDPKAHDSGRDPAQAYLDTLAYLGGLFQRARREATLKQASA
jgi:protein-tyrosine phosphatase/arsenate reductase